MKAILEFIRGLRVEARVGVIAMSVIALDQLTKWMVTAWIPLKEEIPLVPGFFKLVHWTNRGAAMSIGEGQEGNNELLAIIGLVALMVLFLARRHFGIETRAGQIALGMLFGGIVGNLIDRLFRQHVVDFLRFYVHQRGSGEVGFPAFNVADTGICVGVALLFILSWKREEPGGEPKGAAQGAST